MLKPIQLHLTNGYKLTADRLALAIGPWVHYLLRDLHLPVRLTRQYALYFDNFPSSTFSFPAFMAGELYGFPTYSQSASPGSSLFKAASHSFGIDAEPDEVLALKSESHTIDKVVQELYCLLPDLQQAKVVNVDSCIYDVSADERFILDVLPDDPRIVFATGLSGHGFKFGLVLGEILSSLLSGCPSPIDMTPFGLDRFHCYERSNSVA